MDVSSSAFSKAHQALQNAEVKHAMEPYAWQKNKHAGIPAPRRGVGNSGRPWRRKATAHGRAHHSSSARASFARLSVHCLSAAETMATTDLRYMPTPPCSAVSVCEREKYRFTWRSVYLRFSGIYSATTVYHPFRCG